MAKIWFCKRCNCFPDLIYEQYDSYREYREYDKNDDEYLVQDIGEGNCVQYCTECDGKLVEKEENKNESEGNN